MCEGMLAGLQWLHHVHVCYSGGSREDRHPDGVTPFQCCMMMFIKHVLHHVTDHRDGHHIGHTIGVEGAV